MSLAKPLTTAEGIEFDRNQTDDEDDNTGNVVPVWHTLSYDAFAPIEDLPLQQAPVLPRRAAYKVPVLLRAAQVAFAVVACCLASGIVFGYAALKQILIAEGVFNEFCPSDYQQEHAGAGPDYGQESPGVPCAEQDMRLNACFISASIALNMSTVLAGTMLDNFGRRVCYLLSSAILAVGGALMAAAFAIPEFDGYTLGYVLLGIGGTFVFVPSFELANAFPKHSGTVMALVTGAFDASAAVFLIYRLFYDATEGRFSPFWFFFSFLTVPAFILVGELALMPGRTYHSRAELEKKIDKAQDTARDVHSSDDDISSNRELDRLRATRAESRLAKLDRIEQVAGNADERHEHLMQAEERQAVSGVWGVLHGLSAAEQMVTPWFILMLLLTVLQMLRMNYFIATIRGQYRYMLDSEAQAQAINDFFDIALPVAGVICTPGIGLLLNNLSSVVILWILSAFIAVIGLLNCLPFVWAGYMTVTVFVIFRPLYYSAVSDYATKVFGFATFGRIYGSLICISGLANFVQPGLDALTHGPLNGDPTPINAAMGIVGVIASIALTLFAGSQGKPLKVDQLEEILACERDRLIADESEDYGTVRRL